MFHITAAAPFTPSSAAPAYMHGFGVILGGLGLAIGRLFLRRPDLLPLALPLWRWLNRAVRRLERAVTRAETARPDAGRVPRSRAPTQARIRLPSRRAWLVREFGWEVAGFGSQLQHLLGQSEMQAALAARPEVGRILRPICRMLGVEVPGLAKVAPVADGAPEAPVRVPPVRVRPVRRRTRRVALVGPPGWSRPVSHWD